MGVDPGIASTGYGFIQIRDREYIQLLDCGLIQTSAKTDHPGRLRYIYEEITQKLKQHNPDVIAIESLFHSKNLKSLVDVSEAIGVITLAGSNQHIQITKFTPLKVKSAIVGFGKAKKEQVQMMVMNLLDLKAPPQPHHISDALAVAICYKNLHCC
jgi:crossover junction endodeoxyribonuclease RuvC